MTRPATSMWTIPLKVAVLISMMNLATTMTINVSSELSKDLVRNVRWPMFSKQKHVAQKVPSIAAVTLMWKNSDHDNEALLRAATKGLEHRIAKLNRSKDYIIQMLLVSLTVQPKSAAVLHRKI